MQVVHTLAKGSYHFFMTQASANHSCTKNVVLPVRQTWY